MSITPEADTSGPLPEAERWASSALTRRQIMLRSAVSAGAIATAALLTGLTSGTMLRARNNAESPPLAPDVRDRFMRFSHLATGHTALSPVLGERYYQALTGQDHQFPAKLNALVDLAGRLPRPSVEALEEIARQQPALHGALMAVIRAWYSGVVAEGSQATVYAYEAALMYQPARDQVVIPTFAHDGPNYWVKAPPPVSAMPAF
ncbi:sugar dehydrogenase complex small subunit [Novosphingobium terrae]|uniref:sugar dehydrogenase complex small subunit n=1 Tax=Novosphingobium terrae TaxID=2726189 RepID=UPI00197CE8FC|nr:sugar dehydrogenase complex small subunit [Novosphingobium terrae]